VFDIHVLGSSSKGNCIYVNCGDANFLLDCGLTLKQTKLKLHQIGIPLSQINYVFVTHEHIDHIRCLKQLVDEYNIKVVASSGTLNKIKLPSSNVINIKDGQEIKIKNLTVSAKKVNHDATEPLCYSITNSMAEKLLYLTDCGMAKYLKYRNHDVYIIEANYSLDRLELNYETNKIHRVQYERALSGLGHLNLDETIEFLERNIGEDTQEIILSHLSSDNADKESFKQKTKQRLSFSNVHIAEEGLNLAYGKNSQPF
jgi:phosphoribosyl 1,2-cyclic phosphodiesterase